MLLRGGCVIAALLLVSPVGAQQTIRGRALDRDTRAPVAGVSITVVRTNVSTITSADGSWRLNAAAGQLIRAQHVGYAPLERLLDSDGSVELLLEPTAVPLNDLVVTAARRLQRLKDAPVAIELIDEREISQSGAADVAGVLLERTGIDVQAGMPSGSGAMLQGFGSERVLILLDGQPLTGRLSGNFDLTRLPSSVIERIEVVKGPQSTLFGSDALGGVINLITRQADQQWTAGAQLVGGSDQRRSASVRARGALGAADIVAEGGHRTLGLTPGITTRDGAQTEQWDGLVKAGWQATANTRIESSALLIDERQRWRSGQLYNFADNVQVALRGSAQTQVGVHRFTPSIHFSDFDHHARKSTSATPGTGGDRESQRLLKTELLYGVNAGAHTLDAGLELRREAITSPRVTDGERSLDAAETFAQFSLNFGGLSIVPGVRFSATHEWGNHWTPRLAVLQRLGESLALRASIGSGFRAPAFKELYMQFLNVGPGFGYLVRGNPDLAPEASRNISGSVEWVRSRFALRAQTYHNRFDDFIETITVGDSSGIQLFSYGNVERGTTSGLELEVSTLWRGLRAEAAYGLLHARDRATDQPLLGRPEHSARLQLGYTAAIGTRASVTGSYTGATPMQRGSESVIERESFIRFDARMAHEFKHGVELSIGADNLFNQQPANWPGYTGRQFFGGVSWEVKR